MAFAKLFGLFRPITVQDPFFGSLRFFGAARGHLPYWEGARTFGASEKMVEICVDTSSAGHAPTEAQRNFFRKVEAEYAALCGAMEAAFRAHPWAGQLMTRPFAKEFTLSSLSVPLCHGSDEQWDAAFESATDEGHIFTATLCGLKVQAVSVDG